MGKTTRACRPVAVGLLAGLCCAAAARAELVITEIMPGSAHQCPGVSSDWWELTNTGPAPVDLAGYSWIDDDAHAHVDRIAFGDITIDAGESIILLDSADGQAETWLMEWGFDPAGAIAVYERDRFSGVPDQNNFYGLGGDDGVRLYDPAGALVAWVHYSEREVGFSNAWDAAGRYLGISVDGENGAYASLNSSPDVASPGAAVPVPSAAAMLALGAGALLRKKRPPPRA
jgi:hypothetical protein